VPYRIDTSDVEDDVARFNNAVLYYWKACLRHISHRPHEHRGTFVERAMAIAGSPTMTFGYLITRNEYASGEEVYLFTADCFPAGFALAYVLDDWDPARDGYDGEVRVIFVRQR
jgi:hypothetical protein